MIDVFFRIHWGRDRWTSSSVPDRSNLVAHMLVFFLRIKLRFYFQPPKQAAFLFPERIVITVFVKHKIEQNSTKVLYCFNTNSNNTIK